MPYPFWTHPCCGLGASDPSPNCKECGEPGNFEGWFIVTEEVMARYQYVFELAPLGPHRPLADRVFAGTRCWCEACRGRGILTLSEERCSICPHCEGTGGFWLISWQEIEERRASVLEEYPEAAAPCEPIQFLTRQVVQNPETGLMEQGGRE